MRGETSEAVGGLGWGTRGAPFDRALVCPVLIGRDAHVATLRLLLDRASAGSGQTVLVSGEAGIGKSRLVTEARALADAADFLIVAGQSFELDRGIPFSLPRDLLRSMLATASDDVERELASAPLARQLLPELTGRRSGSSLFATPDPEPRKREVFHDLAGLLLRVSAARPLLVVAEDLHWSDETSLEFLLYLARQIPERPVMLLLTYRGEDAQPGLTHFLAELDRTRLAGEINLPRLTAPEVAMMVRETLVLDRPVSASFRDRIVALTDGNPFFIEELLRSHGDGAAALAVNGRSHDEPDSAAWRTPRGVRDVVWRRVAQLSDAAREAARVAAVAGRHFDFALLANLLALDEGELLRLLRELVTAQLIVEETVDRFAFRHALTRQAIADDLLGRERKLLHARIAEAMEHCYADTVEAHLSDLAYHFAAAESWEKALDYGGRAGLQALAMQAPRAAVTHLTRAIDAATVLALPPPRALLRARGQAFETLGEFEPARADHEALLAATEAEGDRGAEAAALLDLGFLWASRDYTRTRDYFARALAGAQRLGEPALMAHGLNRVGNWHLNDGRPLEAKRYHQEALATFEALGDHHGIVESLDLLAMATGQSGDLVAGKDLYQRVLAHCRERDDQRGTVSALTMLAALGAETTGILGIDGGVVTSAAEAVAWGEEALQIARTIEWRAGEVFALLELSVCYGVLGDSGRALALARAGAALLDEIDHGQLLAAGQGALAMVYGESFAFDAAHRLFLAARAQASEVRSVYLGKHLAVFHAWMCCARGDVDRAEHILAEQFRGDEPPHPMLDRLQRRIRAEIALARGTPELALAIANQLTGDQSAETINPSLGLLRGQALHALGHGSDAGLALRAARAAARRQHARPLLWRIDLALGRVYASEGRKREAAAEFAAARSIIDELAGSLPDQPDPELAGASLRHLFRSTATALVPVGRPRPGPTSLQAAKQSYQGLTARERQVAVLIATGMSNRAIAAELVVAERTVESHITHIHHKLGATSRAQIAAWAVAKGLANQDADFASSRTSGRSPKM